MMQGAKVSHIITAPIQAAKYQSSIFYTTPDVPDCQIRLDSAWLYVS